MDALAHVQKITAKINSKTVKRAFCAVRHLEFRLGTMDVGMEPPFLGGLRLLVVLLVVVSLAAESPLREAARQGCERAEDVLQAEAGLLFDLPERDDAGENCQQDQQKEAEYHATIHVAVYSW